MATLSMLAMYEENLLTMSELKAKAKIYRVIAKMSYDEYEQELSIIGLILTCIGTILALVGLAIAILS